LQSLGRLNENFVQAVQARSELDLRVGAAFTRFQTLRLQRNFDGFSDGGVISYGPCQFPTLGFVVERWARIETFVPEDFWTIDLSICVDMNDNGGGGANPGRSPATEQSSSAQNNRNIRFQWKRGSLYDHGLAAFLYEECLEAQEAVVMSLQGRPKNKWRPVPLATVELQKRAARFLRMGSENLMSAAEELYNQGLVSYPRTETEKFRPEFQHHPLIEQFANLDGEFKEYATSLLNGGFQNPRAGQHDDQAHPPITPCKAVDPQAIPDATHRDVYRLIVKHYLACCSKDATGRETQLTLRLASEEFTATALMIIERNWLEIYAPWERWSTGQGELPPLQVGSRIRPSSLLLKEGRTAPPTPISEAELITLMDNNGIGTDATIAQHIATIQDREYARKDGAMRFLPTKLGIALCEAYNSMGYQLNKPDLRRETEAECNNVAAGRKSKDQIMAVLLAKMRQCYESATHEAAKLDAAIARHFTRLGSNDETSEVLNQNFSACGLCDGQLALKQSRNGRGEAGARKMLYCNTCRRGFNLPRGNCQPKQETNSNPVKCPICNFQVVQISRGDGYEGNGYHVCPHCFSSPPTAHGGSAGEFRCFNCRHPTCTLASGTDEDVYGCPFCQHGRICLRKNSRGYVLSCNRYSQDRCPYTIWLPKACQNVTLAGDANQPNTMCATCNMKMIRMTFRPNSVPPHLGNAVTACVVCDEALRRDLEIALPQPNRVVPRAPAAAAASNNNRYGGRTTGGRAGRGGRNSSAGGRGRGRQPTSDNGGGGGGGGNIICYKCGQPGHFANNCPTT
jgi:DNA topoisomerase III